MVCECVKRILFSSFEVNIEIDLLFEGMDFYSKIIWVRFEEMCVDLFCGILEFVEKVLRDVKMDKFKIYEVVLVGGLIRILKIQKML